MLLIRHRFNFYRDSFFIRWRRFIYHFTGIFSKTYANDFKPQDLIEWLADLLCYTMDIIAVPEIYETVFDLIKWNLRTLNNRELAIAAPIFGESIKYNLIRVDQNARFGLKRLALAYVSFNTINYRKKIRSAILIHELVHVWQYQRFGSVYIAKAIKAQRSKDCYNYGGVSYLYQCMLQGVKFTDFNFEQQAEIIEDYYRLQSKNEGSTFNLSVYKYFADQLYEKY